MKRRREEEEDESRGEKRRGAKELEYIELLKTATWWPIVMLKPLKMQLRKPSKAGRKCGCHVQLLITRALTSPMI